MKLESIVNAGFMITFSNGRRMLTDPWFAGPAGQWFNFPPVPEKEQQRLFASAPDYIYISHLHGDHLHAPTLGRFSRRTPIIIGSMNTPQLKTRIRDMGFLDVREFAFLQVHEMDGFRMAIFPDFHGSSEGHNRQISYDLDTSMYLWDCGDGSTLFNAADNTITPEDGAVIAERYGKPTVAVLSCAGASLYPMAMISYAPERKIEERDRQKRRIITKFADLALRLGAQRVVPSGGAYVLGGESAHLTRYLPHPSSAELAIAAIEAGLPRERLCKLYQGDWLDLATLEVGANPAAAFRNFTEQERALYAELLVDHRMAASKPSKRFDWRQSIERSAAAFHRIRRGYGCDIAADVIIQAVPDEVVAVPESSTVSWAVPGSLYVRLRLDENAFLFQETPIAPERAFTRFVLNHSLLRMIMTREHNWSGAECACLIGVERAPDVYNPHLHRLMMGFVI
ncbi:hypothetical protein CCP2SC5_610020 [Azospirillaceae bacterium]